MSYFNSYNIKPDAVKNLIVRNIANSVFYISFDTTNGCEVFQGTDRQKVVDQAALRIKRVLHVR